MPAEPVDAAASSEVTRDWPVQAADAIVDVVDKVRTQTTEKAVVAARAVVFGVVISVLAIVGVTTAIIGLIRAVQVGLVALADLFGYDMPHAQAVYLSYLIVGVLFTLAGGYFWRAANRRARQASASEIEETT